MRNVFLVNLEAPGLLKAKSPADALAGIFGVATLQLSDLVVGVNLVELLGALVDAGQIHHIQGLVFVD